MIEVLPGQWVPEYVVLGWLTDRLDPTTVTVPLTYNLDGIAHKFSSPREAEVWRDLVFIELAAEKEEEDDGTAD